MPRGNWEIFFLTPGSPFFSHAMNALLVRGLLGNLLLHFIYFIFYFIDFFIFKSPLYIYTNTYRPRSNPARFHLTGSLVYWALLRFSLRFSVGFFLLTKHCDIGWLFSSSMNVFTFFFFFIEYFSIYQLCNIFYLQILLSGFFSYHQNYWIGIKLDIKNTYTHAHTHTYMCVCVYVCVCIS